MLYTIENEKIKVTVNDLGAEIMSVVSKENGFEYIWQGNPEYWKGHAYNLFPICGRLWDGKYTYKGVTYEMNLHGFVRRSTLAVKEQKDDFISFILTPTELTKNEYPFDFELVISYALNGSAVTTNFDVVNTDSRELIFTVGGHPGFNLPMEEGLSFEDYYVEFPDGGIKLLDMTPACFVTGKTPDYPLEDGNRIKMNHHLFDIDAIFLCDVPKSVVLKSDRGTRSVKLTYDGMKYLGLWHKPRTDAPYVCIEPWYGVPSDDNKVDDLETKRDMVHLPAGEKYHNEFTIEVK